MKKGFIEGAIYFLIAGGLFFFGVVIGSLVKDPPIKSGDWSGWFQAFGSIAAIGAAIYISRDQQQMVRNQDGDNALLMLYLPTVETEKFISDILDKILRSNEILKMGRLPANFGIDIAKLDRLLTDLSKISASSLLPQPLAYLFSTRQILEVTREQYVAKNLGGARSDGDPKTVQMERNLDTMMKINIHMKKFVAARGIQEPDWSKLH